MKRIIYLLAILFLIAGLVACSDEETPAPSELAAPTSPPAAATEVAPTATSQPTETAEPTAAPTETAEPTAQPTAATEITLERVENEPMGLTVLVPAGWQDAGSGVYARGASASDLVRLIQQAAVGATAEQITTALLPQLGIESLPDPVDTMTVEGLEWSIYRIDVEAPSVGNVLVDLALAETETATYLLLLQAPAEEYQRLHDQVFLPALQGFRATTESQARSVYEDPEGLYSVPVPTNWTAEESDGYVTLQGPNQSLRVHILALDAGEGENGTKAAVEAAWSIVDPGFAREEDETTNIPTSAAGGVDEFILVNYEREEGESIVQVEGRRFQDKVYVLIFDLDLEAYQQRSAQVQIIDTGFEITSLEEVDLAGIEPLPLTDELIAELESYIEEQLDTLDVTGASVAIVRDGELAYAGGFGVQDRETGEPVTPETLMMIGSTTKPVTTMLMASLVDEGVFTWDTPAVEILPSFQVSDPDVTEQLTMRNLVCACTGVPRRDFEWLFNADELDAADIIDSLADFEFFTDFGEAFQYSNQMVATGGYLATLAAGGAEATLFDDYTALLQERMLDPMGMTTSTFDFDAVANSGNHATPYGQTPLGEAVPLPLSTEAVLLPIAPAGAMWSNVLDMANFAMTNLNEGVAPNGTRVVSAENLAVTWEPQVEISADASYGLGWIVEEYKGLQILSHAGNTFGFTSELAFLPEANLGIVILTNQRISSLNQLIRVRLLELLYDQESEVDELLQFSLEQQAEAVVELEDSLVDIDADAIAPYLGDYENETLGTMSLAWQDDILTMDVGEFQAEIRVIENDDGELQYLTWTPPIAGVPLDLEEDDAGNPIIVFGTGVVEYTFVKTE